MLHIFKSTTLALEYTGFFIFFPPILHAFFAEDVFTLFAWPVRETEHAEAYWADHRLNGACSLLILDDYLILSDSWAGNLVDDWLVQNLAGFWQHNLMFWKMKLNISHKLFHVFFVLSLSFQGWFKKFGYLTLG